MISGIFLMKAAGTVVLLGASMAYGGCRISEERQKLREAEALMALVRYTAETIEHTMKPLPEIFVEYRNEVLHKNGFLEEVKRTGLREAWENKEGQLVLQDKDVKNGFAVFCREIGRGYRKEELELCSLTLKRMNEAVGKIRQELSNREKLYRTIPPLMVMSLVLILM